MNDKEKKPGNPWTKSLLIWAGVLFALVIFVQMIDGGSRTQAGQAIAYSEFVRQVDEGNVRTVTIASSGNGGNSTIAAIDEASAPHGYNLGMNQGAVAGAGVQAHLHQHIVPRWGGDSNFLPVIGHTKTVPQLLSETRALLAKAWE